MAIQAVFIPGIAGEKNAGGIRARILADDRIASLPNGKIRDVLRWKCENIGRKLQSLRERFLN